MPGQSPYVKNPSAEVGEGFFVTECRLLILDLVGDTIDCEVSVFGKGDIVLFPDLTELFGYELLKQFAVVVFAFSLEGFHIGFGAEHVAIDAKTGEYGDYYRLKLKFSSAIIVER